MRLHFRARCGHSGDGEHRRVHRRHPHGAAAERHEGGGGEPVPDKADARAQERHERRGMDSEADAQRDAAVEFHP